MFLPGFIDSGSPLACKSGKIKQPSSISMERKPPLFCTISLNRAANSRASWEKSTSSAKRRPKSASGNSIDPPIFRLPDISRRVQWKKQRWQRSTVRSLLVPRKRTLRDVAWNSARKSARQPCFDFVFVGRHRNDRGCCRTRIRFGRRIAAESCSVAGDPLPRLSQRVGTGGWPGTGSL